MAEKSQQLIIDALQRAASAGGGVALFSGRNLPGLFAASAPGKKAAQHCKEQGYLRVLRTENKGKASWEVCAISEKGLAFLLAEQSPKLVLEALVRAVDEQRSRIDDVAVLLQATQEHLDGLRAAAEHALKQIQQPQAAPPPSAPVNNSNGKPAPSFAADLLERLQQWHDAGALGDCPLSHLQRNLVEKHPHTSIGQFHDVLRQLSENEKIYLHPWTGPMYEIPEPRLALMIGHEIAWYVSLR